MLIHLFIMVSKEKMEGWIPHKTLQWLNLITVDILFAETQCLETHSQATSRKSTVFVMSLYHLEIPNSKSVQMRMVNVSVKLEGPSYMARQKMTRSIFHKNTLKLMLILVGK